MKVQLTLENKEIKAIIAKFFEIPVDNVIPLKYNFSIVGIDAETVAKKLDVFKTEKQP